MTEISSAQVALNQRRLEAYYNPAPIVRAHLWSRNDKALPLRCVLEFTDNGDEQYWTVIEAWAGEHNVVDLLTDDQLVRASDDAHAAFRKEDEQINAERRAERIKEYA